MIEPSEDSFETMMERKNPSSKQMESSEGSSNTTVGTPGSGAQEAAGAASSPAQERKELPIDLRQDMEEPSSGPHREIKDPPNDLLQDLEESRNAAHQEVGDPIGEAPGGMEEASVNPWGAQDQEVNDTDLANVEEEESPEEDSETSEIMATVRSIISLYLRMQDLREQQRVAEEILMEGISAGRLPVPSKFSGDRREYHEFIVLCQLILQSYPRMFYNDRLRVGYVMCHLSGMALEWAEALVEEDSPLIDDFPAFLEAMSGMFEYRQALRVAEDAMFNIRQGSRPAIEYINEFQGLVPTLGWSDEVLQAHLCQGLNEEIRHYLFRVPQPDSLDSLIVLVLQIEEKLAERRAMLRLPPEARPRNLTWIDSPAPERWMVSSWLPCQARPPINRDHLYLLLLVRVNPYHSVAVQALVDSGAGGSFMDEKFAQEHYVELYEKPHPKMVQGVDGSLIGNEPVWLYTEPLVCIHQNHQESIEFDIVPSPNFSVILGIDWLRLHTPEVDWIQGRCTFHSPYCLQKCFRPPPPCIALERHAISLLPGLPPLYSDLADVFNPKEADDETSDQPSSDGSDDLSESEPSELQQAGDSDHSETFYECPSIAPWEPVGAGMQNSARPRDESWNPDSMLTNRQDYVQVIPELFDQLHGATWFTKLELRGTVVEEGMNINQAEDVWKAAFGFEPQEMKSYRPFPLSSDPTIPQNVLHFILKDMLGYFVLSYGRDVLVYSMSQEEHFQHVRQVLVRFRHHHVYCSLDRSQFHRHTVEFLGFVITPKGVRLNKSIVNTVTGYPTPGSKKSLRHLIEFVLPYQHFVERFHIIIEPLARLLLTEPAFSWGDDEQGAFDCLKRAVRRAPLLHHPKPQNPFYLETGVTKTALHASLSQRDDQTGRRVSCAFYSRSISPIETAYSQLEMKILPIRAAFTVWCRYLENTEEPIMILLNTEDLASLNNDRLTVLLPGHWVFFFSHFNFDVMEPPAQDSGRRLPPPRNLGRGASRRRAAARTRSPFSPGGSPGARSLDSAEDEEAEDAPAQGPPSRRNLQQEFLARIPIDQILHSVLAHVSVAQIRAVVLHFFRGLLFWKDTLAVAALLVLLKLKRRLAPPVRARAPPRRWLRLGQAPALRVPGSGLAAALAQLLAPAPPPAGPSAVPAHELAALLPYPGCAQRRALLPLSRRGLQLSPGFWLLLCDFFGVRVGHLDAARTPPRGARPQELHVVADDDVVLQGALQGDLQRCRQRGLHDGLQDTSQDERDSDVLAALLPRQGLPEPSDVLAFLSRHPPRGRESAGRADPVSQELAARALIGFLTAVYARVPPAPAAEPRLQELPRGGKDEASHP
ncbi:retrotransposon-like protein 1 [Enhydra lutris kenyoni]|uniref:Retrotransposon-like protein 1 n=1 Tax=Enhydra lutris kenyoni TaxID=391180 RepID=A0A2Y9JJL1_ENHLU|nr:retrotransposon-like protein 1 [Enhydra lutris kenyoni]